MKTFKKLFSVSAIVALLGTIAPMYAFGATYTAELEDAYTYAYAKGVTTMTSIDNADMYGSLTRVAMAKMIANYATTVLGLTPDTSATCSFSDVTADLDAQYDNGVTKACQLGLMGQNITAFRPFDLVTRGEFGTTLSRALNANSADLAAMNAADPYYKDHLNFLKDEGIMNNISNPAQTEVRGYVMLMMMRADDSYTPASQGCTAEELLTCITATDYDACIAACSDANSEEENLPGYAKVTGNAESSQNVALNAVDKKIGTVTLKAGENDTTVTTIEITKSGLGAAADIANIQLTKNGEYVTTAGTLNSNKVAKLRFRPNLVLKANSSETFDVVVSMAGSGTAQPGGTHDFAVTSVTVANGTFDGTPVRLGSLTTTNYLVSEATIALSASSNLKAGETNKEIARVNIDSPVDATLSSITIDASNTLNEDLFNILSDVKAYIDDQVVGTVTVNEETIVISNLSTDVEKNDDIDVVLKGTNVFVGNLSTVSLTVDTGHVVMVEKNTNERMNSTKDTANLGLQGVDLKITNNITTAQNATINQKNVVLLDMTISSSSEIEVAGFYVKFPFTGSTIASGFKDGELTLYVDGIDYTIKSNTLGATGGLYAEYSGRNDYFTVSANNSVRVQLKGTPTDDCPTTISNIEFGITDAKNVNERTPFAISAIKKSSHRTNVKGGNVTVSKATTPSANTIEMNSEEEVLFFKVKSPSEDVRLTGFNLTVKGVDPTTGTGINNRASTPITNIAIYVKGESNSFADFDFEGNALTDWDTTTTTGTISTGILLTDFTKTISAGETVEFVVKATFDNGEIVDLGDTYQVSLTRVWGEGVTSKTSIPTMTSPVDGTQYKVVTEKPDVVLVKNGKFINVTLNNNSTYDVVFNSGSAAADTGVVSIVVESVATVNDRYLLDLDTVGAVTVEVLDGDSDGANVIGTATILGGVITATFNDQFTVSAGGSEDFTIKLVSTKEIKNESYNVSKKSASFNYFDNNSTPDTSKLVEVRY